MSISTFAPGRVEILGNHTDYNGGVVLSAALHLGITATGEKLPEALFNKMIAICIRNVILNGIR